MLGLLTSCGESDWIRSEHRNSVRARLFNLVNSVNPVLVRFVLFRVVSWIVFSRA